MKKAFIIAAIFAASASLSKAQGGGGGGAGFQQAPPAERAKTTVDGQRYTAYAFTADQKAKIVPILTKFYVSSDSLNATITATGQERGAAMQALAPKRAIFADPAEKALVALLTPDQKKTYDTALAAAKERNPAATGVFTGGGGFGGGNRGGGGGAGGGGNRPAGGGAPATPPNE